MLDIEVESLDIEVESLDIEVESLDIEVESLNLLVEPLDLREIPRDCSESRSISNFFIFLNSFSRSRFLPRNSSIFLSILSFRRVILLVLIV